MGLELGLGLACVLEHSREHSRGHKHAPRDHLYVVDDDEQRAKDPEGLETVGMGEKVVQTRQMAVVLGGKNKLI